MYIWQSSTLADISQGTASVADISMLSSAWWCVYERNGEWVVECCIYINKW